MKHTTQYLYDLEPSQLIGMPYEEALKLKALSGRELLFKLVEPSYDVRDSVRIDAVQNAVKFNYALLEELKCC